MTKQFLHRPDVRTVIEHVGGAGMAQDMGCESLSETGGIAIFAHDRPRSLTPETPSTLRSGVRR